MPYYPPSLNLPVVDTQTIVMGSADNTKLLRFEVDGFTTGTTRVLTPPNADATIAGLEVANVFTVGQTIQTTSPITFTTDDSTILGSKSVTIREIGDQFGAVQLKLQNRQGAAGAIFRNESLDLVDFGFLPSAAAQMNLRFEGRSAFHLGANNTKGELQVLLESLVDNGILVAGFGDSQTVLQSTTALTNSIKNTLQLSHITTGTPAEGLGVGLEGLLESSTTEKQSAGRLSWLWATATHATRKARSTWTVYDTAEREGIRIEADGSAPMIGFLGASAIVRQAHIADPSGGGTQDAEARTAINAILAALENFGLIATS